MSAPNVLLLDEPTNDLDIPTLTILEAYLDDFAGAVIVVSHDRYFLDIVCEKIFAFEGNGAITVSFGNFSDYLERQSSKSGEDDDALPNTKQSTSSRESRAPKSGSISQIQANEASAAQPSEASATSVPDKPKKPKFTFSEAKEYETIDARIAEVEKSLKDVQRQMERAGSDYGKVQELYNQQKALEATVDELLERWTYLNELAEAIEQSKNR